jgi:hypothetical protein
MSIEAPINMPASHANPEYKCGLCQWFHVGFEGKTCQKTRKVQSDTRACIEFQQYKNTHYGMLSKDKFLKDMTATLTVYSKEKLDKDLAELAQYRLFKTPDIEFRDLATEENMILLAHSFEVCQAYTDRVLEIKQELSLKRAELDGFINDSQAYIFSQYSEMVRTLKNETERNLFFRFALPAVFRASEKLDTVLNRAEGTLNNLKQTHFSLCQMQDGAKEVYKARIQSLVAGTRSKGIDAKN